MKKILSPVLLFLPITSVFAHGVGEIYSLPIPIDYYLYTSAFVVFLSFFLSWFFSDYFSKFKKISISSEGTVWKVIPAIFLFLILLAIGTGIFGNLNISKNFSVIFFWIYFIVGLNLLNFLFGNFWEVVNPWKFLVEKIFSLQKGPYRTPKIVPLFLVFSLYWFELVSGVSYIPMYVGYFILGYTVMNIVAYKLFTDWFTNGELFSIIYRYISFFSVSKININPDEYNYFKYTYFSFLFICILLAGISYDSIKETLVWFSFTEYLGLEFESKFTQTLGLILTILPFSLLYLASISGIKYVLKVSLTVKELVKSYLPSLSPIVLGYFMAHNFSVFIVSIPIFLPTLLDPFGFGWNLFGINSIRFAPLILGAKFIWYIEIFFIVGGHVCAVLLSHFISKRIFVDEKVVFKADMFILPLMVAYTVITLWLISLPLVSF